MPTPRKLPPVTPALAERHEALWLKLSALHKQIAAVATRKPETPVGEQTRSVAEALLAEAWVFGQGADDFEAAPDHGGLLTQLGQALAEMEHYELRHTGWHSDKQCFMWTIGRTPVPVRRLRPTVHDERGLGDTAKGAELRRKLAIRIEQYKRR